MGSQAGSLARSGILFNKIGRRGTAAALQPRFRASTFAKQKRSKINYLTRVKSQGENYRQGNYNLAHVHGVAEMAPRDTPRVHGKFKVTFTRNAFPSVRLGFNSCLP